MRSTIPTGHPAAEIPLLFPVIVCVCFLAITSHQPHDCTHFLLHAFTNLCWGLVLCTVCVWFHPLVADDAEASASASTHFAARPSAPPSQLSFRHGFIHSMCFAGFHASSFILWESDAFQHSPRRFAIFHSVVPISSYLCLSADERLWYAGVCW